MYVTVFYSKRESEVRVTRGCGWVRHHKDCYKADNADHLETVCQCFDNYCNSAGIQTASIYIILTGITTLLLRHVLKTDL